MLYSKFNFDFFFEVPFILRIIFFLPIFTICLILFFSKYKINILRNIAVGSILFSFFMVILLYLKLKKHTVFIFGHQLHFYGSLILSRYLEIGYGIDGISIWFLLLTIFLILIVVFLSLEQIVNFVVVFYVMIFLLEFALIGCFIVTNLFWFCIFFELASIPVYKIIILYGSIKEKRILAGYQFFIYTYVGSIIMFLVIFYIHARLGSLEYLDLVKWVEVVFSQSEQSFIWLLLAISFSIKVPIMPLHRWLPEAHVEAPTVGSVVLAGLLMKLGGYAIFRYLISIFNVTSIFFVIGFKLFCLFSIIFCMFISFRQLDFKKGIAYLSIAHMNVSILGIISNTLNGIEGGVFLMFSHGLISSGLFICAGYLYDKFKTRNLMDFGGLINILPQFSVIFFLFVISNIAFPMTSIFIGEFLSLLGIYENNSSIAFIVGISNMFMGIYSIWFYSRIVYGRIIKFNKFGTDVELNSKMYYYLCILLLINIIFGILPNVILQDIYISILCILR